MLGGGVCEVGGVCQPQDIGPSPWGCCSRMLC
jgi:hypothetical protein